MNHSPLFATRHQTGLSHRMVAPFSSRDHLRRRPPPNPQFGGAKKEGCALTAPADGKKRSCHAVSMEDNDPVGCSRSPNNRCIVRPEPRKCEYYQAKTSPRCRTTKDGDHDDRCSISNETGRCALASAAKSPRKPRVPKKKLSRPDLGLPVKLERSKSAPLPPSSYTGGYVFY